MSKTRYTSNTSSTQYTNNTDNTETTTNIRASLLTPTPTANENQGQPLSLLQDIRGV